MGLPMIKGINGHKKVFSMIPYYMIAYSMNTNCKSSNKNRNHPENGVKFALKFPADARPFRTRSRRFPVSPATS